MNKYPMQQQEVGLSFNAQAHLIPYNGIRHEDQSIEYFTIEYAIVDYRHREPRVNNAYSTWLLKDITDHYQIEDIDKALLEHKRRIPKSGRYWLDLTLKNSVPNEFIATNLTSTLSSVEPYIKRKDVAPNFTNTLYINRITEQLASSDFANEKLLYAARTLIGQLNMYVSLNNIEDTQEPNNPKITETMTPKEHEYKI